MTDVQIHDQGIKTGRGNAYLLWHVIGGAGIGVGLFLRWNNLGAQSLWFDEGYTAWMIGHTPGEIIRLIRADTAPPLYYLLLKFWTELFGDSEWAMRSMSALFMSVALLVALPIMWRFVKSPAGRAACCWALALSYFQVEFAQEARAYALMTLLIVSALYCLLRHLESRKLIWLIPVTLLLTACLYTHTILATYLVALAPAWLVLPSQHSSRKRLRDGAMVFAGVLVLYLPWAIFALSGQMNMIQREFWVQRPDVSDVLHAYGSLLGVYHFESSDLLERFNIHLGALRAGMGLPLIILAMTAAWRAQRKLVIGLTCVALLPPMAVLMWSQLFTRVFMEKSFIASAVLLPILLMMPVGNRSKSVNIAGVIVLLFMAGSLRGFLDERKEDWRGAAQVVASLPEHRRLIVFVANDGELPFDYYYRYRPDETATGAPAGFFDLNPPRAMMRVKTLQDLSSLQSLIQQGHYDDVILVAAHTPWADKNTYALDMLESTFPRATIWRKHLLSVFEFSAGR